MTSGREVLPALGLAWANCINQRLFVSRCQVCCGASFAALHVHSCTPTFSAVQCDRWLQSTRHVSCPIDPAWEGWPVTGGGGRAAAERGKPRCGDADAAHRVQPLSADAPLLLCDRQGWCQAAHSCGGGGLWQRRFTCNGGQSREIASGRACSHGHCGSGSRSRCRCCRRLAVATWRACPPTLQRGGVGWVPQCLPAPRTALQAAAAATSQHVCSCRGSIAASCRGGCSYTVARDAVSSTQGCRLG